MGAAAYTDDVAYLLYFVWSSSYLIPQDFISVNCVFPMKRQSCVRCAQTVAVASYDLEVLGVLMSVSHKMSIQGLFLCF
jgi:hypothetical protein